MTVATVPRWSNAVLLEESKARSNKIHQCGPIALIDPEMSLQIPHIYNLAIKPKSLSLTIQL